MHYDDGARQAAVYDRASLGDGTVIEGPALVEEPASVTVLRPDQTLTVDSHGNLIIRNR